MGRIIVNDLGDYGGLFVWIDESDYKKVLRGSNSC